MGTTYRALNDIAVEGKSQPIKKGEEISQDQYEKLDAGAQNLFIQTGTVDGKNAGYQHKTDADNANAAGSLLTHEAPPDLAGGLKENLVPVEDKGGVYFENVEAEGNEDLIAPAEQPTPLDVSIAADNKTGTVKKKDTGKKV